MIKKTLISLLFTGVLFAQNHFILHNDAIIIDKAAEKIEKMCSEIAEKTGVGVYTSAVKTAGGKSITEYTDELTAGLNTPYVVLAIAVDEEQIEMVMSPEVAKYIDKDEILDEYIIPILVSHNKKASPEQKFSAAIFNGVAEITDEIATEHNIVFANSVGSESKNFYEGIMWIIKLLLVLTAAVLVYIYLSSKKERA